MVRQMCRETVLVPTLVPVGLILMLMLVLVLALDGVRVVASDLDAGGSLGVNVGVGLDRLTELRTMRLRGAGLKFFPQLTALV